MSLIRTGFYFTSFFGLGYAMMNFISLNEEKVRNELKPLYGDEEAESQKKNKLFMDTLRAAADNKKPLYAPKTKGD